jgi:hypothetical protein
MRVNDPRITVETVKGTLESVKKHTPFYFQILNRYGYREGPKAHLPFDWWIKTLNYSELTKLNLELKKRLCYTGW